MVKNILCSAFFLWLVFEKIVNTKLVDHLEKYVFFYDFQYDFRFLTLGLLQLQHLIYPSLPTGFGMLIFFTNLSLGISCQVFGLIQSFLSNRWPQVLLYGKYFQE